MVYILADFGKFKPPFFDKKSDFGFDGVKIEFLADFGGFYSLFLPKNGILALMGVKIEFFG